MSAFVTGGNKLDRSTINLSKVLERSVTNAVSGLKFGFKVSDNTAMFDFVSTVRDFHAINCLADIRAHCLHAVHKVGVGYKSLRSSGSGSGCCSCSASCGYSKRGTAGVLGEVKEVEVVEVDVEMSNVKLDRDIEAFFVVGPGLDADASAVEVVIVFEAFAAIEEMIMD